MRNIVLLLLLTPFLSTFAQSNLEEEDRIIHQMCNYLKQHPEKVDSIKVEEANQYYLYPYLDKQKKSEIESILDGVYFRYQKLCPEFMAILDKVDPLSSEEGFYVDTPEKPIISNSQLIDFKNTNNFYYQFLEDITKVEITKGFWLEKFSDGTFSKTKMDWITETSFKLTFIESNNPMKAAYSREGEEYMYDVLKKEGDFYWLQSLQSNGKYIQFKLYIN